MERTNHPRFRPTVAVWPASPPSVPPVRPGAFELQGDLVALLPGATERDLPADWFMQEVLQTEPSDVLDLMRQWGPLAEPGRDLAYLDERLLPRALKELPTYVVHEPIGLAGETIRNRFTLAAAQYRLRLLRALAGVYLADREGDDAGVIGAWTSNGFAAPDSTRDAWVLWSAHVNAALRAYPMFVHVEDPGSGISVPDWISRPARTTYEVAVLQLVLTVAGDDPVRRCANVHCNKPFTKQRTDRRHKGTVHSLGVKYCSRACAKAQSERDRRARQKQKREAGA